MTDLILVEKEDERRRLVFDQLNSALSSGSVVPLITADPTRAVALSGETRVIQKWDADTLAEFAAQGPCAQAQKVIFAGASCEEGRVGDCAEPLSPGSFFIRKADCAAEFPDQALEAFQGKYFAGNLVCFWCRHEGGVQHFVVNDDGTVSPHQAPHLVLGLGKKLGGDPSTFKAFLPSVISGLQEKGMWVNVESGLCEISDVIITPMRDGIGVISLPGDSGESAVVIKLLRNCQTSTIALACNQMLTDAKLASLLLHTPKYMVETAGIGSWDALEHDQTTKHDGISDEDSGRLLAKMHSTPTVWFTDELRGLLQQALPILKEEPDGSCLYSAVHHQWARYPSCDWFPSTEQLRPLMKVVPRPQGEYASRVVTVHGDFHYGNIIRMPNGEDILIDFETSVVSTAAQDLCFLDVSEIKGYLSFMMGRKPTQEELYSESLDAVIAAHVHFFIVRPILFKERVQGCIDAGLDPAEELTKLIDHTRRLAAFVDALRKDPPRAEAFVDAFYANWGEYAIGNLSCEMDKVLGPAPPPYVRGWKIWV